SGAFFGVYGPQSGFESRTSSLITPLKALADSGAFGAACSREQAATARAAMMTSRFLFMTVSSSLACLPILRARHEPEADVRHRVVGIGAAARARAVREAVVHVAQERAAARDALRRLHGHAAIFRVEAVGGTDRVVDELRVGKHPEVVGAVPVC